MEISLKRSIKRPVEIEPRKIVEYPNRRAYKEGSALLGAEWETVCVYVCVRALRRVHLLFILRCVEQRPPFSPRDVLWRQLLNNGHEGCAKHRISNLVIKGWRSRVNADNAFSMRSDVRRRRWMCVKWTRRTMWSANVLVCVCGRGGLISKNHAQI